MCGHVIKLAFMSFFCYFKENKDARVVYKVVEKKIEFIAISVILIENQMQLTVFLY